MGDTYRHSHLPPVGEVARPGNAALVDGVPDDAVEALLGRRGAKAHGVAAVQVALGRLGREQRVLLDAQLAQLAEVTVVPAQVRVGVAEPAHQRPAAALDDLDIGGPRQLGDPGHAAHVREALPLDVDVAREGGPARAVEDAHVTEQDLAVGRRALEVVGLGLERWVKVHVFVGERLRRRRRLGVFSVYGWGTSDTVGLAGPGPLVSYYGMRHRFKMWWQLMEWKCR